LRNTFKIHPDAEPQSVKVLIADALFNPDGNKILTLEVKLQRAGFSLGETSTSPNGSSDLLLNIARESDPVERARLEITVLYLGGVHAVWMLQRLAMSVWRPDKEFDQLLQDYLRAGSAGRAQAAPARQHLYDCLFAIDLVVGAGLLAGMNVCPILVARDGYQRAIVWGLVYDVLGPERAQAAPLSPSRDSPALHTAMWPLVQSEYTSRLDAQLLAAARTVDPSFQRLDDVLGAL
jgi:hypothetical protein